MARHPRPSSARGNRRHHAHLRQTAGEIEVHRARIMTTVSALEPTRTSFWTPAWRAVVFLRFGAMILGQPIDQPSYSLAAHLLGWAYHFSNGITFGIMYLALIGDSRRRAWWWGIILAVGLELVMLFTPYPGTFGIKVTA